MIAQYLIRIIRNKISWKMMDRHFNTHELAELIVSEFIGVDAMTVLLFICVPLALEGWYFNCFEGQSGCAIAAQLLTLPLSFYAWWKQIHLPLMAHQRYEVTVILGDETSNS